MSIGVFASIHNSISFAERKRVTSKDQQTSNIQWRRLSNYWKMMHSAPDQKRWTFYRQIIFTPKKEPYLTGMAKSHCSKIISMKVQCWNLSVAEWNLLWCIQAKNVIDVTREGVGHMSMSCEIWDFNVKRGKGISRTFWTMGSTPI